MRIFQTLQLWNCAWKPCLLHTHLLPLPGTWVSVFLCWANVRSRIKIGSVVCLYTPVSPSVPEMESICYWNVPLLEFMYPVFTRLSGGITVGDSGLYCYVPCLMSAIATLYLLIVPGALTFQWLCSSWSIHGRQSRFLSRKVSALVLHSFHSTLWSPCMPEKRLEIFSLEVLMLISKKLPPTQLCSRCLTQ